MAQHVGIITSGGDCPGLNAAIRAIGKGGQDAYGMHVIGFLNGFRGLVQDRRMELDDRTLSGMLTEEQYGVMVAVQGREIRPVPLEEVSGKKKFVSPDHPLVQSARLVSTCFGD